MLYYNYHQCTGGSPQEFDELTLGRCIDIITTYVNMNSKNQKKNKNERGTVKGEKVTYMRVEES